jgi:hypothetical protein
VAECGTLDLWCKTQNSVSGAVGNVVQSAFEKMCQEFAAAGAAVLDAVAKSFLATSTIDLREAGIDRVFATTATIGAGVALLLLFVQVIRTALTMRGEHLATGIAGVFKAGLAIATVATVAGLLLAVADELSLLVMEQTVGGREAFTDRFARAAAYTGVTGPGVPVAMMLIYGLVAVVVGIVLFAEMLFRHALVVVIVAVSPIAAAGMVAGASAPWWRKLVTAGLQLIFLEPLIVLIFGVSFAVAGNSNDVLGVLAGLTTLAIAAAAWPLLAKTCTWSAGHVSASGGPGAFLGGLAGAGAGMWMRGRMMSTQARGSMFDSNQATIARNNLAFSSAGRAPALAGAGLGPAAAAYGAARTASYAKDHLKSGIDQMSGHAGLGGDLPPPGPLRPGGPPAAPPSTPRTPPPPSDPNPGAST